VGKRIIFSKTFWFNILAGVLPVVLDTLTGFNVITPDVQAGILTSGNLILRAVTKEPIKFIK